MDLSPRIEYLMDYGKNSLYTLREDKLPYSYGGNKLRMSLAILQDFYAGGYDCLIGYGSLDSNFNRIIADLAKDFRIDLYLITSFTEEEYAAALLPGRRKHKNEALADAAGGKRIFCLKQEVKQRVEELLTDLRRAGKKPYYVYGDSSGKGNHSLLRGVYAAVYGEIKKRDDFDCICLCYGTGLSFEGLAAGKDALHARTSLVGISIAREITLKDEEKQNFILPDYIEEAAAAQEALIAEMAEKYDFFLDPIYTGRAFYGLLREMDKGRIKGKVLFVHTGGYPIHEEFMERRMKRS